MIKNLLYLFFIFSIYLYGQSTEQIKNNYLKRIQLKLNKDIQYLNLYKLSVSKEASKISDSYWKSIVDDEYKSDPTSTSYNFYFRQNSDNPDHLIIVNIERVDIKETFGSNEDADSVESKDDALSITGIETMSKNAEYKSVTSRSWVSFAKLYELQKLSKINKEFENIYNIVRTKFNKYLLGINNSEIIEPVLSKELAKVSEKSKDFINTDIKNSKGYSSRDNSLFLNYQLLNSFFLYENSDVQNISSTDDGAYSIEDSDTVSGFYDFEARYKLDQQSKFHFDATFSRISFYHDWMNNFLGKGDNNNGLAVEISAEEEFLNILPYTGLSLTFGLRSLFILGNNINKAKNYHLDTRIFYKAAINTEKLVENLPFLNASRPNLNFANRFGIDFTMSKQLSLPYLNFYLALGGKEFSKPYVGFYDGVNIYSYFSITQASATMSFYWNTSRDDIHRFRLDIGGGYYDKFKVFYTPDGKIIKVSKQDGEVHPIIALHFNFVPDGNDLFGTSLNVFNSIGELTGWIKLLDFADLNSTLRFEATYISRPLGRRMEEWETKGGAIFQFRFRYGMSELLTN